MTLCMFPKLSFENDHASIKIFRVDYCKIWQSSGPSCSWKGDSFAICLIQFQQEANASLNHLAKNFL